MVIRPPEDRETSARFKPASVELGRLDGHPVFCLKHLSTQKDFSIKSLEKAEQCKLLDKLRQLSQVTWNELHGSPRHQLGYEKITRAQIKASIPPIATDDVTFIAFRFNGKAPMVGFRQGDVFRLLWVDPKFSLYDHG